MSIEKEGPNVLFLGFAIPDSLANIAFDKDALPSVQTQNFGWSFSRALGHGFGNVYLVSSTPIQSYPRVKLIKFSGGSFLFEGFKVRVLGFVNLIILKHITRLIACFKVIPSLIRYNKIDTIFVHGLHSPFLIFGLWARLNGCKVIVILTDSPGLFIESDGTISRFLKRIDSFFIRSILKRMDGVVALSSLLAETLVPKLPSLIFPGILNSKSSLLASNKKFSNKFNSHSNKFTIVYAGTLNEEYGVRMLIDAVVGMDEHADIILKLYGRGNQVDFAKNMSLYNKRIYYGGFVSSSKIAQEMCSACLLINPRPSSEDFSRMSFPSKLIEYLGTGRPVLTTRIFGIPRELESCFYYIDTESVEGIQLAIQELMNTPIKDREMHGLLARSLVQNNFSEKNIGCKLYEFVNGL